MNDWKYNYSYKHINKHPSNSRESRLDATQMKCTCAGLLSDCKMCFFCAGLELSGICQPQNNPTNTDFAVRVRIHVSPKLDFLLQCAGTPPPCLFYTISNVVPSYSVGYVYSPGFTCLCVTRRHIKGTFYLHSGEISETHLCLCHFRFLSVYVLVLFPLSASQTQWTNSGVNLHFKGIHAEQEDFPRQSKQGLEVV